MNDSHGVRPPQAGNDDFKPETDDPEIEELLRFEPAPRRFKREDGWTAALQRKFIAKLAQTGSSRLAAQALGKDRFGIEKVYKAEGADSFRAAWDRAVEIYEERAAERAEATHAPFAGIIPPGVDRRRQSGGPAGRETAYADTDDQPEIDEGEQWELIERIATKFMKKVAVEREARLNGEIVAADFYLRQITMIEVTLDLLVHSFARDPHEVLRQLRRGKHTIYEIAGTEFSDWLDASRRDWWRREGDPQRPPHPDVRFVERLRSAEGAYAVEAGMCAGAWATPPPGVGEADWQAMTRAEQAALIDDIRAKDAEEQAAWERRAREEWEARNGERAHGEGAGR